MKVCDVSVEHTERIMQVRLTAPHEDENAAPHEDLARVDADLCQGCIDAIRESGLVRGLVARYSEAHPPRRRRSSPASS